RRANANDLLHFFGVLRIDNSVGRLVGNPGDSIAVLFAHRLRCHDTIAKSGVELGNYFLDRRRISGFLLGGDARHSHTADLCWFVEPTLAEDTLRVKRPGGDRVAGTTLRRHTPTALSSSPEKREDHRYPRPITPIFLPEDRDQVVFFERNTDKDIGR